MASWNTMAMYQKIRHFLAAFRNTETPESTPDDDEDDLSGTRLALGGVGRVLLVEADPAEQARVARRLGDRGVTVVGTSSAEGALELVEGWRVDLALVSEELTGLDGLTLCRELAARGIVTVFVADSPSPSIETSANESGAIGCLARPIAVESLTADLSALLRPALVEGRLGRDEAPGLALFSTSLLA